MLLRGLLIGSLALISAATAAAAGGPENRLEMTLGDGAVAGRVEMHVSRPEAIRPERRAVTDLLLDVWTPAGAVAALLDQPNVRASRSGRSGLSARLMIVSGGKIHTGTVAACGAWEMDIAVCEIDCDGGRFALERRAGVGSAALTVLIGTLPRDIDIGERPGFALSPCGIESAFEVRLVPKSDGRPVELGFVAAQAGD